MYIIIDIICIRIFFNKIKKFKTTKQQNNMHYMNHMLMYIGEKNDIRTCTSTVRTGYTMEHTSRLLEKRILSVSTGEKRMISFIVCHFSFYSPCSTTNPSRSKAFLFLVIHLGVVVHVHSCHATRTCSAFFKNSFNFGFCLLWC